jgi:hypothetical protein
LAPDFIFLTTVLGGQHFQPVKSLPSRVCDPKNTSKSVFHSCFTGWATGDWKCNFYTYSYTDGWGHVYRSDYTLPVIITYLAAYVSGLAVYLLAWASGSRYVAGIGLALCIVGLASFGIEVSHWLWPHNLSWIASFPAVMFPLAAVAGYRYCRRMAEPMAVRSEP